MLYWPDLSNVILARSVQWYIGHWTYFAIDTLAQSDHTLLRTQKFSFLSYLYLSLSPTSLTLSPLPHSHSVSLSTLFTCDRLHLLDYNYFTVLLIIDYL